MFDVDLSSKNMPNGVSSDDLFNNILTVSSGKWE